MRGKKEYIWSEVSFLSAGGERGRSVSAARQADGTWLWVRDWLACDLSHRDRVSPASRYGCGCVCVYVRVISVWAARNGTESVR